MMRPKTDGASNKTEGHRQYRPSPKEVAGIKDASAKVWGSRNQYQVMKAIVRMLLPGREPTLMGNGLGRRGRTMENG